MILLNNSKQLTTETEKEETMGYYKNLEIEKQDEERDASISELWGQFRKPSAWEPERLKREQKKADNERAKKIIDSRVADINWSL